MRWVVTHDLVYKVDACSLDCVKELACLALIDCSQRLIAHDAVNSYTQQPLYLAYRRCRTARPGPVNYNVGDTVRILDGPLSSFTGTVESIEVENNAVNVVVSMFGRETSVEFELDMIEVVSQ